jgi:uncharacterized protein (DUF1501 family)
MVLLILRGGMDGLFTVPAVGDPAFEAARGSLGHYGAPTLPLQGPFALHPSLVQMHAMYGAGELAVLHAAGQAYRDRSHFDAQQVLESGGTQPYQLKDGWLGRALRLSGRPSVALNTAVPLVLRGSDQVDTWAPSALPDPSADLLGRLTQMYSGDKQLASALDRARNMRGGGEAADGEMAQGGAMAPDGMAGGGGKRGSMVVLATQAGRFLAQAKGPQVAVLDMGGWDTHYAEDGPKGPFAENLRQLDATLAALRDTLSAPAADGAWRRTVVVVATEFGRSVEINGSHGTDHGNGSAAFVLGGAVQGGRVIADWPGLAKGQRFEGRDLAVTTDLRAVFKGVLRDHLGLSMASLDQGVFPGSASIRPLALVRS